MDIEQFKMLTEVLTGLNSNVLPAIITYLVVQISVPVTWAFVAYLVCNLVYKITLKVGESDISSQQFSIIRQAINNSKKYNKFLDTDAVWYLLTTLTEKHLQEKTDTNIELKVTDNY